MAGRLGYPVLLTDADRVSPRTLEALLDMARRSEQDRFAVEIVGGAAVVGAEVEAELERRKFHTSRIAGADRLEKGALLWSRGYPGFDHQGNVDRWLADAYRPADALAAGAAAVHTGASLLLVDGADLLRSSAVVDALRRRRAALERIELIGGTAAINGHAVEQLETALLNDDLDAPRCRPEQLRASLHEPDSGLGKQWATVQIVNVSGRVCTLRGRVQVTLADAEGRPLQTETRDSEYDEEEVVPLAPDGPTDVTTRRKPGQAIVQLQYFTWPTVQECYDDPSRVVRAPQVRVDLGASAGESGSLQAQAADSDVLIEACRGRLVVTAISEAL